MVKQVPRAWANDYGILVINLSQEKDLHVHPCINNTYAHLL